MLARHMEEMERQDPDQKHFRGRKPKKSGLGPLSWLARLKPALPRRHPMRTRTRPSDGNATVLCQPRRSALWGRSTALVRGNLSAMSNRAEVFSSCRGRLANLEIERQGQWSIDPQEQGGKFGKRTGLMLPRPADAQLKWRTKHAA